MRRGRRLGAVLAFQRGPNWHPPLSRERLGGRVCPSWRVWGSPFSAVLREIWGRVGDALQAWL